MKRTSDCGNRRRMSATRCRTLSMGWVVCAATPRRGWCVDCNTSASDLTTSNSFGQQLRKNGFNVNQIAQEGRWFNASLIMSQRNRITHDKEHTQMFSYDDSHSGVGRSKVLGLSARVRLASGSGGKTRGRARL